MTTQKPESKLEHVGLDYDKTKGYAENISCSNCHWRETIYVPFGKKIKDYLNGKECERCHCVGVLY